MTHAGGTRRLYNHPLGAFCVGPSPYYYTRTVGSLGLE